MELDKHRSKPETGLHHHTGISLIDVLEMDATCSVVAHRPRRCNHLSSPLMLAAIVAIAVATQSAAAQTAAAAQPAWHVQSAPDADIWFHGLAVAGFEGFGPLHMYDPGYASSVRAEKVRRGLYPTLLDRKAAYLKTAFERDSAFEIMHFVPLYFLARDGELLDLMKGMARPTVQANAPAAKSRGDAVAAVGGVLRSERQRKLLFEFAEALDDERRVFYDDFVREASPQSLQSRESLAEFWNDNALPRLAAFLRILDAPSGLLIVSPALGSEGRSVRLGSGPSALTIVAVGMPRSGDSDRLTTVSAVRELCFPIVRKAIGTARTTGMNRVAADRLSSIAAVRCGSHVIEKFMPSLLSTYQARFLRGTGADVPRANLQLAFFAAFPIPQDVDRGIIRALVSH